MGFKAMARGTMLQKKKNKYYFNAKVMLIEYTNNTNANTAYTVKEKTKIVSLFPAVWGNSTLNSRFSYIYFLSFLNARAFGC